MTDAVPTPTKDFYYYKYVEKYKPEIVVVPAENGTTVTLKNLSDEELKAITDYLKERVKND